MHSCFHHFLLFSAEKKWGLHLWGFLQLILFCHTWWLSAGSGQSTAKHRGRHGGLGTVSGKLAARRRVRGSLCLRVAELYYLSGSPAATQLGEGHGRLVGKLRSLRNVCCYWEVTNFEPKETELNSAEAEGLILSSPKIHRLCCLTWDPIDIRIVVELWCSWLYHCECIRYPCVFAYLRFNVKKYLYMGISGSVRWGYVCVCICGNCCVLPSSWHPGCYSAVIYLWTLRRSLL